MKLAILLMASGMAFGQTAGSKLTFEVASVRPAEQAQGELGRMQGGPGTPDPGRVTFTRSTLAQLLTRAYDVWPDQVLGPAWLKDYRGPVYTVSATMPPDTTKEQFRIMLQNLLAERFHMKVRKERQSRPGYELVLASGGHRLKPFVPDDGVSPAEAHRSTLSMNMSNSGAGAMRQQARETMAEFCRELAGSINVSNGAPTGGPQPRVADKTGLAGMFEFSLEFAGSLHPLAPAVPPVHGEAAPSASDPGDGLPSIFAAVEKQLGLKLVKVKDVPVEVIIVDAADKVPTEN
jgi:uncharacterized protein (TIGR03435 family)